MCEVPCTRRDWVLDARPDALYQAGMRPRDEVVCAFKAHRLVYHSTLGSRVIKKKNRAARAGCVCGGCWVGRDPVVAAPAAPLNRGREGVFFFFFITLEPRVE